MPALLKAFLEQVIRPGIAFEYLANGGTKMLLSGCSARIIVTMSMPTLVYRVWFGTHGVKCLSQSILNFAGIRPVRYSFFGLIQRTDDAGRRRFLTEVETLGRKGI